MVVQHPVTTFDNLTTLEKFLLLFILALPPVELLTRNVLYCPIRQVCLDQYLFFFFYLATSSSELISLYVYDCFSWCASLHFSIKNKGVSAGLLSSYLVFLNSSQSAFVFMVLSNSVSVEFASSPVPIFQDHSQVPKPQQTIAKFLLGHT